MQLDDLSSLPDESLCVLEADRTLEPEEWRRIDDELRRRRRARMPGLAHLPGGAPPDAIPSLGDLERVAAALSEQLLGTQRQLRRLRWWVLLSPLLWMLLAAGVLAAAAVRSGVLPLTWP